jgi:hypothetical protein
MKEAIILYYPSIGYSRLKSHKQTHPNLQERTLFRAQRDVERRQTLGGYSHHQDAFWLLDRKEITILYCLRTGHTRLKSHRKQTLPISCRSVHSLKPSEMLLGQKESGRDLDMLEDIHITTLPFGY